MCAIDGADPCEISSVTHPKARKIHRCGECGRSIMPGEVYHSCFMVMEGCASTFKVCAHCQTATKWLAQNCGGWLYEGVLEEIVEHAQEYPYLAEPLLKLAEGMRSKWNGLSVFELPPPITVAERH